MGRTTIEWAEHTINPIRARHMRTGAVGHYCEKISTGCKFCYASKYQLRRCMPQFNEAVLMSKVPDSAKAVEVFLDRAKLREVLKRTIPTVYFWADMTDLFGHWVSDPWLDECFATMLLTPQHTHLVLTKRIDRAFKYFTKHAAGGNHIFQAAQKVEMPRSRPKPPVPPWPWKQIKLGVSMENQEQADKRLPTLLATPAGGYFVSIEPQIGPVTIKWAACSCDNKETAFKIGHLPHCILKRRPKGFLDLVIDGGESGSGARPFNLQWPRSLIRQCHELELPLFIKQLGAFPTMTPIGTREFEKVQADAIHKPKIIRLKLKARKGNHMEEWPADLRVREAMKS